MHRSRLLIPLFIAACTAPSGNPSGDTSPDYDSSWLLAGAECIEDDSMFEDLRVETTGSPTVLAVSWTTAGATRGWVDFYGEDEAVRHTNVQEDTPSFRVMLLGLRATEDVVLRGAVEVDGQRYCTAPINDETSALPSSLSTLTMTGQPIADYTAAVLLQEADSVAVVINGDGEYVFAQSVGETAFRALFARDGSGLLVNRQLDGWGDVAHIAWDGAITVLMEPLGIYTDFVELPDGRLASIGGDHRPFFDDDGNELMVLGETIMVQDDKGVFTELWNAFDMFEPDLHTLYPPDENDISEWTHGNGLSYSEESNQFYISLAGIQSVAAVDAATGDTAWVTSSQVQPDAMQTPSEDSIKEPHSVYQVDEDTFVIFNRHFSEGSCSSVTWLDIDAEQRAVDLVGNYEGSACLSVTYLGEARPTSDNGTLISWTTAGVLERIDADQQPVWQVASSLGGAFGFTDLTGDLYVR